MWRQRFQDQLRSRPEFLCAVMLLALLPLTCQYVLFHPDEQHYVDAGIKMVETGDYLTPLTPDGTLRLRKPIIPYWFVVAGYHVFGISPIGSRFVFVLGACALVWLTWRTADALFESHQAGIYAALVVMCHPALLISAARAVPDLCLTLFTTLSCYGFVAILKKQRVGTLDLWAAYGGGVLAVLSKGIPAAVFVAFATAFLVLRERPLFLSHWKRFGVAIVGAIFGGLSWFIWMWRLHEAELIEQFLEDQVGSGRFAQGILQVAWQAPVIAAALALTLTPWLLPTWNGITRATGAIRTLCMRSDVQLLLSWCGVYVGLAATINQVTMRYLLPMIPFLAVCFGGILSTVSQDDLRRPFQWLFHATLVAVLVAGTFFVLVNWPVRPWLTGVVGLLTGSAICLCWRGAASWSGVGSAVGVGCAVYGSIGLASLGAYPILFPSVATQIAESLQGDTDLRPVLLMNQRQQTRVTQAARLRVAFGGRREVLVAASDQTGLELKNFVAVVSDSPNAEILSELPGETWERQRLSLGFPNIGIREVIQAAFSGQLHDLRSRGHTDGVFVRRADLSATTELSRLATSVSGGRSH